MKISFLKHNCNHATSFFGQRLTILSLGPQVENVVHIPTEILKTKPILNSAKNLRKDCK